MNNDGVIKMKPLDNIKLFTCNTICLIVAAAILLSLILIGCSGKEVLSSDKRIPDNPVFIPHLGDTGDDISVQGEKINDSNNGIDTVPDGDWIRIQWQRIDDPDIDHMKIYRYGDYAPLMVVDSLSRSQIKSQEFLDKQIQQLNPVGQKWSYYGELYLTNGYYSTSDTVSYHLLEKPFLTAPQNNVYASPDELEFKWLRTEDALHYRVLVFNADYEYIWHKDFYPIEDSDYKILYSGPDLTPYTDQKIIWRVDSFGSLINQDNITISGAESQENIINLIADP